MQHQSPLLIWHLFQVASASPISFDSNSAVESSSDALLRAHAVLMIFAWVAFVPVATMMPRYFKGRWDHQVSGAYKSKR